MLKPLLIMKDQLSSWWVWKKGCPLGRSGRGEVLLSGCNRWIVSLALVADGLLLQGRCHGGGLTRCLG